MEFPFGKQTSKDFLFKSDSPIMERGSRLRSSLTEGSSRFLGSLNAKKNGLIDGISSTFDQVQTALVPTVGSDSEEDSYKQSAAAMPAPERPPTSRRSGSLTEDGKPKEKPKRPPAPTRAPSFTGTSLVDSNGSAKPSPSLKRQQTAPVAGYGDSYPPVPGNVAINFEQPLYGVTSESSNTKPNSDPSYDNSVGAAKNSFGSGQDQRPAQRMSRNNPFLTDNFADSDPSGGVSTQVVAEVHGARAKQPGGTESGFANAGYPSGHGSIASGTVSGSNMAAKAGSDLLPGFPGAPSTNSSFLAPQPPPKDLLAITPTSGEALPMPSLQPEHVPASQDGSFARADGEIYDDSDGDSEATEGCDEVPDNDYGQEPEDDGPFFRSGSVGSDLSWSSSDSHLDEHSKECMEFMKGFIHKMFDINCNITQSDKARFGELCQSQPGRLWFARYVNAQRVHNKKVDEQVFYCLVQYFAICLFECKEAEDYGPAKTLMNMCFTFFHEVVHPVGPSYKHFLYSYLKDQPIWQSLRFWNAAFFDAVQHERARKPVPTSGDGNQSRFDDREYQENITFGQLGTFTCNMRSFGLSKQLCLEFLRKQSTIANLKDEQIAMLRENTERWTDQAK